MPMSRRQLLLRGWRFGGAMLAAAAGWTSFEALRPLVRGRGGGPIALGSPSSFKEGTATYVHEARLYVVNVEGNLLALSQKCPHLGCRVPFCESSGRFECPCHGSIFDLAGEYVAGPAPRGMDRYEVAADPPRVVVDTATLVDGPDRGEQRFLTPPKGPSCVEGA